MVSTTLNRKEKKFKINNFDLNSDVKDPNLSNLSNSSDEENFLKSGDLEKKNTDQPQPYKMQLVWKNIIAFTLMHYYSFYGLNHFLRLGAYKVFYLRKFLFSDTEFI